MLQWPDAQFTGTTEASNNIFTYYTMVRDCVGQVAGVGKSCPSFSTLLAVRASAVREGRCPCKCSEGRVVWQYIGASSSQLAPIGHTVHQRW